MNVHTMPYHNSASLQTLECSAWRQSFSSMEASGAGVTGAHCAPFSLLLHAEGDRTPLLATWGYKHVRGCQCQRDTPGKLMK